MKYVKQKVPKSVCPDCERGLTLLCPEGLAAQPMFYICWECMSIFQVGVGPVEESE